MFVEEDVDAALQERGVVESLRAQTVTLDPRVVPLQWNTLFQHGVLVLALHCVSGNLSACPEEFHPPSEEVRPPHLLLGRLLAPQVAVRDGHQQPHALAQHRYGQVVGQHLQAKVDNYYDIISKFLHFDVLIG